MPSLYTMTRLGPDGHNENYIIQNGTIVKNSSANPDWDTDALAAFQDKNLNHYFTSNDNGRNICSDFGAIATTDAQIQSLYYDQGIPSNEGGVLAITDRNANADCDTASGYVYNSQSVTIPLGPGDYSVHLYGAVYGGDESAQAAFRVLFGDRDNLDIHALYY